MGVIRGYIKTNFLLILLLVPLQGLTSEKIHLLIPGGAGGGWDATARGAGDALLRSGLAESVSYENISGGGGTKAIAYLIETANRQQNTLLISSTPIILQALKGIFPQTYKDLVPVATVVADYGAFVVKMDSKYQSWAEMIADYKKDARNVKVAGGSVRGSMDHLVAALAFKQSGADPQQLRYIPYNAGAKAMVGLLSGETQLLSTGLSEAIALMAQSEVRILATTAPQRVAYAPEVPTLHEVGVNAEFTNWRGFFAAPGTSPTQQAHYHQLLNNLYKSKEWEEIRARRGWTHLNVVGEAFSEFLAKQEQELDQIMVELGMKK